MLFIISLEADPKSIALIVILMAVFNLKGFDVWILWHLFSFMWQRQRDCFKFWFQRTLLKVFIPKGFEHFKKWFEYRRCVFDSHITSPDPGPLAVSLSADSWLLNVNMKLSAAGNVVGAFAVKAVLPTPTSANCRVSSSSAMLLSRSVLCQAQAPTLFRLSRFPLHYFHVASPVEWRNRSKIMLLIHIQLV